MRVAIASFVLRCVSLAAFAASSAASAGEVGPTSTASIVISVIIPPHLSVREVDANGTHPTTTSIRSRHFCILSKGIRTYSVTLAGGQSALDDEFGSAAVGDHSAAITWSDGHSVAKMEAGQTVVGFRPATSERCDDNEGALATLGIDPNDRLPQLGARSRPLIVIIAAD